MQLKLWLVRKHPSHIGMQLKYPVYKICVHLRVYHSQCCSGASGLIVTTSKWQKNWNRSKEERARSLARKRKRRLSVNAATTPWSPCRKWWVWETTISSRFVHFENALTFSNYFNVMRKLCLPSHTFHTSLHMHDRLSQKHVPRLLIHTCWFRGHGDEPCKYNTYT